MPDSQDTYLRSLVNELRKLPRETEWVEFKHNNANPDMIGERLSALANSAALEGKTNAYVVWGIELKPSTSKWAIVDTPTDSKG